MTFDEFLETKDTSSKVDHTKFSKNYMFRGHHYEREEKGRVVVSLERFSYKYLRFVLFFMPIPISGAIYLYMYEKDDLETTARQFVKHKT